MVSRKTAGVSKLSKRLSALGFTKQLSKDHYSDNIRISMTSQLFRKGPKGPKKAGKIMLYDAQFSSVKDALRKKNKAKANAEAVVMEWYVIKPEVLQKIAQKNK